VVHRDLKPANVFLTAEGVKLLDFGQARAAGLTQLAAKSAMMGTPGYLAPELLAGQRGDARSDLYAVGAILFELLAGRRAYDSDDPFRVAQLQAAGAASPRSIDNSITESDDATVRRALDPDPERRFASAGQLGLALGGGLVPAAPVVPPGLTRGGNDVWVSDPFESIFEGESKAMRGFLALFGARKSALAGLNDLQAVLLVSGASSEAAEEVARLAAAHGLVATVRPTAGGWLRSLARTHPLATPLLAFGMAGPGIAALLFTGMDWFVRRLEVAFPVHRVVARSGLWDDLLQGKPPLVIMACLLVCACGLLPWALLPSLHAPAVEHLAEGDPVVVRLLEGIRRRVAALLQRANTSGAAGEALAGLVQQIAQEAEAVARTLAVEAPAAEATTLPAGFPAQEEHRGDHRDDHRDAGIARLLHAAASLDAALADTAATGGDGLSRAVAQLRGEVEFVRAQAALPGPSTPPGSGS
jgi:hypothetical protein